MGRKNRKGRGAKQNPSRFHREKRQGRQGERPDDAETYDATFEFGGSGGDVWSSRARRKRRRRSGAIDAVEGMEAVLRHETRELDREDTPRRDGEPGPLWLIDAADVKSLPHPSLHSEVSQQPVKEAICGNCREWVPPGDPHASTRGRCLHPASGVSYPPSEYDGCPFFA